MAKLFYRYSLQKRNDIDDGFGNKKSGWVEQFQRRGERTFFKGREKVISASETGTQELIIKLRSDSATKQVTTGWRMVDIHTNETYNIRGIEPDMGGRKYIDFLVQSGVADG